MLVIKNLPASAGDIRDTCWILVRKIPWRRAWQPTQCSCLENPTEEPGELQFIRLYSRTQLKQLSMHACIACIRQIVWENMEGERIKEKKSYKGLCFFVADFMMDSEDLVFQDLLRNIWNGFGIVHLWIWSTVRIIYPSTCASHCWNVAWLCINFWNLIKHVRGFSVFLLFFWLWSLRTQVESERNVVYARGEILSMQRGLKLACNCFRHHSCVWDHSWKLNI